MPMKPKALVFGAVFLANMADYQAKFFEDGNYIGVEFPDLPGCFSQGDDMEGARIAAAQALRCYFDELEDDSHKKLYNEETQKTIVIPMNVETLGEKLQAKIRAVAGV